MISRERSAPPNRFYLMGRADLVRLSTTTPISPHPRSRTAEGSGTTSTTPISIGTSGETGSGSPKSSSIAAVLSQSSNRPGSSGVKSRVARVRGFAPGGIGTGSIALTWSILSLTIDGMRTHDQLKVGSVKLDEEKSASNPYAESSAPSNLSNPNKTQIWIPPDPGR